jgi:hypothetical protein
LFGWFAVGGPPGVPDAAVAGQRLIVEKLFEVVEIADGFPGLDVLVMDDRDSGRVVPAIFKAPQPGEADAGGVALSDISHDAAHAINNRRRRVIVKWRQIQYYDVVMPRRASSGIHPAWIIVVILLIGGAIGVGYFLMGKVSDPYRTLTPLSVSEYLENSNSLRGNTYKVTGTVWNSLAWSPTTGRLFSIEVQGDHSTSVLPLLIPASFNQINIQKGQRYVFKVEIDEKGILKVKDLNKV